MKEERKEIEELVGKKSNCGCKHTGYCKKWLSYSNEY